MVYAKYVNILEMLRIPVDTVIAAAKSKTQYLLCLKEMMSTWGSCWTVCWEDSFPADLLQRGSEQWKSNV